MRARSADAGGADVAAVTGRAVDRTGRGQVRVRTDEWIATSGGREKLQVRPPVEVGEVCAQFVEPITLVILPALEEQLSGSHGASQAIEVSRQRRRKWRRQEREKMPKKN